MIVVCAMLVLAVVCWMMRVLFIAVVPASRLPGPVHAGLRYLAPAVLASLIVVELAGQTSPRDPKASLVVLASMLAAGLVVRRSGSMLLAIAVGAAGALAADLVLR